MFQLITHVVMREIKWKYNWMQSITLYLRFYIIDWLKTLYPIFCITITTYSSPLSSSHGVKVNCQVLFNSKNGLLRTPLFNITANKYYNWKNFVIIFRMQYWCYSIMLFWFWKLIVGSEKIYRHQVPAKLF